MEDMRKVHNCMFTGHGNIVKMGEEGVMGDKKIDHALILVFMGDL